MRNFDDIPEIKIGNDLVIEWTLTDGSDGITLEGAAVMVKARTRDGVKAIPLPEVSPTGVRFHYPAAMQTCTGPVIFDAAIAFRGGGSARVDSGAVFRLVEMSPRREIEMEGFNCHAVITLQSSLNMCGERGPAFTFDDFTDAQLEELKRPATEAAVAAGKAEKSRQAAESKRETAETERQEAEEERQEAETARADEFAGWQAEIDGKADKAELSNVLAAEPLTPGNFPDIDTYTREQLKMDLFVDIWNSAWGEYGKYDPANAPDAQHPFLGNKIWMTYAEAQEVMAYYPAAKVNIISRGLFSGAKNALTFPPLTGGFGSAPCDFNSRHFNNYKARIIRYRYSLVSDLSYAFSDCYALEEIIGELEISPVTNMTVAFNQCFKLREVRLRNLRKSVDFHWSPDLSFATLSYLVEYAMAALTVTVHPDVYAKLTDETNTEWHAILARAAEKNINFATV